MNFSNKFIYSSGSDRRSKMISAPTNFSHISHMGPDIQKQRLIDLPVTSEGSDQSQSTTSLTSSNQRIAAIRGGPIPPRTPPRPSTMPTNYTNKRQVPTSRHPPSSSTSLPRSPSPLGKILYEISYFLIC